MIVFQLIFGFCVAFIYLIATCFNITYNEASVYINLYTQYGILFISCTTLLWYYLKYLIKKCTLKNMFRFIGILLYTFPIYYLGIFLYNRYFSISANDAFYLCRSDLLHISGNSWEMYYIVNILIFIIWFLFILIINHILKNKIRKIYDK